MTIGFFDSGVGGLSILREVQYLLPTADTVYFADTKNVPYGSRPDQEIIQLSLAAVTRLLPYQPDLIVVACNTATSIAIAELRRQYPNLPMIGVVPVLNTLAKHTRTKRVAVCATAATLSSRTFQELKKKFTRGIDVLELARPEWVTLIESGDIESDRMLTSIHSTADEILAFGADAVALGSTHFPWLRPMLEPAMKPVRVFDSGAAVARQVLRVLIANAISVPDLQQSQETFIVSGDGVSFSQLATRLLARPITATEVFVDQKSKMC